MIKSTWILAGRPQPSLLFEIAPFFLASATTCLATAADGLPSRRRTLALGFGALAITAGLVAAVTELIGTVWGTALAVTVLAILVSLVLQDRHGAPPERLAWWIGVTTLPLNLLGGLLATLDERLLELPLAILGASWIWLGVLSLRRAATQSR